ncbi:MAG: ABC transporter permease [Myxococcaceae bacterium]|nr:ABC transporter permease [Myxococcaceae bacterium]
MKRLFALVKWDAALQARHHIFTANVVSTLAFCGLVVLIPSASLSPRVASFLLFADPALIGLSFVGAAVLMERGARVNLALGVTPMSPWEYVASKALVLTCSGTASGLLVAATLATRGATMRWGLLLVTLVGANLFAVLLGFVIAAFARSMNQLMMRLLLATMVLFAPLLSHFGAAPWWLFAPFPSAPILWGLDAASGADLALGVLALAASLLVAWCALVFRRAVGSAAAAVFAATP